jgi:two-component system cell cycle sensor histidine kinase/response regulator CckA
MSEQQLAESEQGSRGTERRAEEMLQAVMRSVLDAIITINERGMIQAVNPAVERLFGYPAAELVGQSITLLMPEPHRTQHDGDLASYLRTGIAAVLGGTREVEARRKDGSTFPAEVTVTEFRLGDTRHFTGVVRDLTERRKLEAQVHQAQKMDAIGRLAGGVAHDFNNLLTVINGYAEILLTSPALSGSLHTPVAAIRDAGERAAGLTAQLLAFSRKAVTEPRILDFNDVVARAEKLLRRLIGEDIYLTTVLDPALCRVKVDPTQLEQVILNLAVNARDAMPRGGRLTIQTRNIELRKEDASRSTDCQPGPYVQLVLADTGHGMTDEVKARIFEPFFTTKGPGKGTGLGLATVYGIVKQSGGHIGVESEVGVGSTFKVLLPAVAAQPRRASLSAFLPPPGGTETILLVEDDDVVRGLAQVALEQQGYKVLQAGNGTEAVGVVDHHAGPVHLLVTDVVMPGMGGRQLADTLRPRFPVLRVLYASGYTDDAVVRHGIADTDAFLQKPFTPTTLARKVRSLLDDSR